MDIMGSSRFREERVRVPYLWWVGVWTLLVVD